MFIVFFAVNLVFSIIFFIFSRVVESVFFLILGFFFLFYFNPYILEKKKLLSKQKNLSEGKEPLFNEKSFIRTILIYLRKGSYYLSFLLFYLALFWLSISFGFDFSVATLIIAVILFTLFFESLKKDKRETVFLVFRSNFVSFSIIFVFLIFLYFFWKKEVNLIFIINTFLSISAILVCLFFDDFITKKTKQNLYTFFLFYLLILIFFYLKYFIQLDWAYFTTYIFSVFSFIYFFLFTKIEKLKNFVLVSRFFGVILSYISIIFSTILLFYTGNPCYYFTLIFWIIFNGIIYNSYINYLSLLMVLLSISFIYTKALIWIFWENFLLSVIFIYFFPSACIWYIYGFQKRHLLESHFINYFWVIFSIIFIISFFIKTREFSIGNISIFFLIESIILFLGFIKLKSKN